VGHIHKPVFKPLYSPFFLKKILVHFYKWHFWCSENFCF
jgi:hypothetical protein